MLFVSRLDIGPNMLRYVDAAIGMSQEVIAGRHDGMHQLQLGLEILLDGFEKMRLAGSPTHAR